MGVTARTETSSSNCSPWRGVATTSHRRILSLTTTVIPWPPRHSHPRPAPCTRSSPKAPRVTLRTLQPLLSTGDVGLDRVQARFQLGMSQIQRGDAEARVDHALLQLLGVPGALLQLGDLLHQDRYMWAMTVAVARPLVSEDRGGLVAAIATISTSSSSTSSCSCRGRGGSDRRRRRLRWGTDVLRAAVGCRHARHARGAHLVELAVHVLDHGSVLLADRHDVFDLRVKLLDRKPQEAFDLRDVAAGVLFHAGELANRVLDLLLESRRLLLLALV